MDLTKTRMFNSLPFREAEYTVRHWKRSDLDELAAWPSYPLRAQSLEPMKQVSERTKEKETKELGKNSIFHYLRGQVGGGVRVLRFLGDFDFRTNLTFS